MNMIVHFAKAFPARTWPLLFLGLLLSACGRDDTKSYRVPKEAPAMPQAGLPAGHPDISAGGPATGPAATPRLSWTKPEGWNEAALGQMRAASFNVKGDDGKQADISVIPLPGAAGGELANVNRWRGQVGLAPLSAEELAKTAEPVEIAGQPAQLYDVAGSASGSGDPTRILGVIQQRDGMAWFFKMTGNDPLVAKEKTAFVAFLKSVKYEAGEAAGGLPASHPPIGGETLPAGHPDISTIPSIPAAPATPTGSGESNPKWEVPADWKSVPPGAMQVAKFSVPEASNAKADVMISIFPNSTGGTLANVNRWRNQIGLAPVDESSLAQIVKPLEEKNPEAVIADMSNGNRRLVGAIVPRGGQWYFFKLLGDDAAVAPQKAAFTKFVQTVKD
jgi:hypothetical protein